MRLKRKPKITSLNQGLTTKDRNPPVNPIETPSWSDQKSRTER